MNKLTRNIPLVLAVALLGASLAWLAIVRPGVQDAGPDVTFFVLGDLHIGGAGSVETCTAAIEAMNSLPGVPWPREVGGVVSCPRGVLIPGDLTDSGGVDQWEKFVELFGLTGQDALLRYPVFEGSGNHDRYTLFSRAVVSGVEKRHGALNYCWNWSGVQFISLDQYPDPAQSARLAAELAPLHPRTPVILFMHYIAGDATAGMLGWDQPAKEALLKAISGRNVLCIIHGHDHWTGCGTWRGYEIVNAPAAKAEYRQILVVRIGRDRMHLGWWDYSQRRWERIVSKHITR